MPQNEETFQVFIDVIKNSMCFKAFTISADVPEIFMQQFWYIIKKVQGTDSYESLLANKKYRVDAEVFRKILDICPRVEGEEFIELQNDDDTLTFLIDLSYKGLLHKYTNMYVDHMSHPWSSLAVTINKCLSGKTTSNDRLRKSRIDIIRLKFVRIGEDYQEYELAIPDVMMNDAIKQSESYQMFIKYSTGQIPLRRVEAKVYKERRLLMTLRKLLMYLKTEPEPVKKKTASRRVVMKKVTIFADDNSIPDPDVTLELGKSISLVEAEEEAEKQVYATHERIVTESVPESAKKKTGSRSSRSVVIQDTLKAVDIMQALKESKKTNKRQLGPGDSSERTGTIPWIPDKSAVVSATSNDGTGIKPGQEKVITKEKVTLEWGSIQESEYSEEDQLDDKEKDDKEGDADDEGNDYINDTQDTDDEDAETKSDEDEIYKYKICVHKDEDVEMTNAKVEDFEKGDAEISDVAQADVEKTEEIKDAAKKAELPPTSSSLSVSLGFGDQFLKLSFDNSLVSTIKDNIDAEINSLLEVKIQSEVPHIQSLSVLRVLVSVISEPVVLTLVEETSSAAPVTTLPLPSVSTTPPLRVAKLEKDVSDLKNIYHSAETIAALKEQEEKQKMPKYTIKSTDKAALKEYDQKSGKKTKRSRTKESESSKKPSITKETPKGKASSKGSKTGKSASAKESVEEPIAEVVMDDVGRDNDQPQDTYEPKTAKTLKSRMVCSFMLCDLDFEPLSLSLSSLPSCDLVSLTNILILCLILKASNQS
ncbi:hypothetical protein Tco_1141194 [Tanacetum coccineum]